MPSYFKNSYKYEWENTQDLSKIKMFYDAAKDMNLNISLPKLFCYAWNGSGGWEKLFQMNTITKVYRTLLQLNAEGVYEDVKDSKVEIGSYQSGATSMANRDDKYCKVVGNLAWLRIIKNETGLYPRPPASGKPNVKFSDYYSIPNSLAEVKSDNVDTINVTLEELSNEQIESGMAYKYEIECLAFVRNRDSMMTYYEVKEQGTVQWNPNGNLNDYKFTITTNRVDLATPTDLTIKATIYHQDMSELVTKGPFIRKGVKYSAYQLLRKALLTCDTYIVNNGVNSIDEYGKDGVKQTSLPYSIVLDDKWVDKLKLTAVNETIFEQNNLWEVLLQIGYYLHAIPYMSFANDGTDRFVLSFKQLGSTEEKQDTSQKITIFNSQNLSEYYTQLDSYVTNLFSPQNKVEEWVTPKTSESSFLVSNNTAELHLAYPITEILKFKIKLKLKNGTEETEETEDATKYLFEKSVYDVICNEDPYKVYPTKGSSLYYNLGDNKIQGLNFVPPSSDGTEFPMALKRIIEILWQGNQNKPNSDNLKFNELQFYVKYRTQDNARVNQFRPDIMEYMKNCELETYPHHEQFYGQQGKIIDSERLSANLFGKLIRVGNGVYQMQEYVTTEEKRTGELYRINGEPYYVIAIDTEYYSDAILQKVTYSKNFNQLAQIATIPSEPRFYEIAERSKIRREVRINDFFVMTAKKRDNIGAPKFLNGTNWTNYFRQIVFNESALKLPNYAWSRFCVDKLRDRGLYKDNQMFPSSIITKNSNGVVTPGDSSDHSDVILPLVHYPMHNGIVFSWQMEDNFKAGDFTDKAISGGRDNDAYYSQQPMRYVDIFGRADLVDFRLFYKEEWEQEQSMKLPQAVIEPQERQSFAAVQGENNFLALDKDNREEISFNYQVNLLHDEEFVTYPNLFGEKENGKLRIALLDKEQSAFNENQLVKGTEILASSEEAKITYSFDEDTTNGLRINIVLAENSDIDLSQVKSIIFYEGEINSASYAIYIVRNVGNVDIEEKLNPLYVYPVYN